MVLRTFLREVLAWMYTPPSVPVECLSNDDIDRLEPDEGEPEEEPHGTT